MVICLERGADLHMAQLMPLPRTVSCFSKIQIGFTFLVPAHLGTPGKRAVKRVCGVCVCVCESMHIRSTTSARLLHACSFRHPLSSGIRIVLLDVKGGVKLYCHHVRSQCSLLLYRQVVTFVVVCPLVGLRQLGSALPRYPCGDWRSHLTGGIRNVSRSSGSRVE